MNGNLFKGRNSRIFIAGKEKSRDKRNVRLYAMDTTRDHENTSEQAVKMFST